MVSLGLQKQKQNKNKKKTLLNGHVHFGEGVHYKCISVILIDNGN